MNKTMNEELNLVEVLKNCPKGTKLYSPIFGAVEFREVRSGTFPIVIDVADRENGLDHYRWFTANGRYDDFPDAECMLFPSRDNRDWSTFVVPKSLPKTWMEFCQMHDVQPVETYINDESMVLPGGKILERNFERDRNLLPDKKTAEAMLALCQLIQLRDCYNDGWQPDWRNSKEIKYCICFSREQIFTYISYYISDILTFKTEELRNLFLTNFRDLIEIAKPLYNGQSKSN